MTKPNFRSHSVSPQIQTTESRKDHSSDIGNPYAHAPEADWQHTIHCGRKQSAGLRTDLPMLVTAPLHNLGAASSLISSIGAMGQPGDRDWATPVAAMTDTVSGLMRPDASVMALSATRSTAAADIGLGLYRRRRVDIGDD
jgi:hypothetical protein